MRLDQMGGVGEIPEKRKRLSDFERRFLIDALALLKNASSEEGKKDYVVDIAMALPSGFLDWLYHAVAQKEPLWPESKPSLDEWRLNPIELSGCDKNDVGLWGLLPSRLYRRVMRHGESPDKTLITVTSELLDFCEWCSEVFAHCTADAWPDIPPLRLAIESTCYLVASQRFDSQQDGEKWLTLTKETFNTPKFVSALQEIDARMEDEEPAFRGPYLLTRVEEKYCGWLPHKGFPTEKMRSLFSQLRTSGIQNADRAMAATVASLRDRGYVLLRGQFQSPDTKWVFPAECVLTGTGYLRAKRLAGETEHDAG